MDEKSDHTFPGGPGPEEVILDAKDTHSGDDKDRQWFRVYSAFFRDEPSAIIAMEELISTIQNETSQSRSAVIRLVFRAGLKALSEDPAYATAKLKEHALHAEMFGIAKARAARKKEFATIYEQLGPMEIQRMAAEKGVNVNRFLDDYRLDTRPPAPSLYEQMKQFITDYLDDGQEHSLTEVVEEAIRIGLLPEKDSDVYERDYGTFRTVASELKVSSGGRRGYWQMSLKD